tara:strand:- start:1691 stop:1900 length:210 start_codon:yes stop_codon:yes gene_type:complete
MTKEYFRRGRSKASVEKGISITLGELPKFLLTGKVVTGRQGQTTKYKRRGTFAGKPFGRLLFFTGEEKR